MIGLTLANAGELDKVEQHLKSAQEILLKRKQEHQEEGAEIGGILEDLSSKLDEVKTLAAEPVAPAEPLQQPPAISTSAPVRHLGVITRRVAATPVPPATATSTTTTTTTTKSIKQHVGRKRKKPEEVVEEPTKKPKIEEPPVH